MFNNLKKEISKLLTKSYEQAQLKSRIRYDKYSEKKDRSKSEKFLKVVSYKMATHVIQVTNIEKKLYLLAIDEILSKKKYKIKIKPIYDYGSRESIVIPTYNQFDNINEINKELLTRGALFISDEKNNRIVVECDFIQPNHEGVYEISVVFNPFHDGSISLKENIIADIDSLINSYDLLKGKCFDFKGEFINIEDVDWSDLIISEEIKNSIEINIINYFNRLKELKEFGFSGKRGILLVGPPGCGKSLTGKIIASQIKSTFILVTPSDIKSSNDIKSLYKLASRLSPSIIFIEDGDLFLTNRLENTDNSILAEMLNLLDGLILQDEIITIITANNPDNIDKALIYRPGRFDVRIEYKIPDQSLRLQMLKRWIEEFKINTNVDLEEIVKKLSDYSGAHIKELLKQTFFVAFSEDDSKNPLVKEKHFLEVIKSLKPLIGKNKSVGFD